MPIDDHYFKRSGFISTISLFFSSGYSAVLGVVAYFILTILLSPEIFGIYIVMLSIIPFFNYFSEIGLAASLIQKESLTDTDIKTAFTTQQILILNVVIIGFFATTAIQNFYNLPQEGVYLYWALLAGFFISSLKTIPSIFLERKIQFQKIVLVQAVENTIFYIAISIFALMGWGLMSFTVAVLLRAVTGLILIYSLSFWMPQFGISISSLKTLLSFGVPYQASNFLALFKDDLIILYLGKILGFEGLAYVGWAKKWADAPMRIIMDNISKVIFPLIARVQGDTAKVKRLAERILYYQTAAIAPVTIGMIVVLGHLIGIIPGYEKWLPALPLFYIFALSSLLLSFSAPFMPLFNALGKVKFTFSFMIFFTALNWIFTPILTAFFGIYGFPITHVLVSFSFLLVLDRAKSTYRFHFFASIYKFIISAFLMGVAVLGIGILIPIKSYIAVGLLSLFGAVIYYLSISILFGVNIKNELQSFLHPKKP